MSDYTAQEMMVAVAAREIGDGELVFVGMRLPVLAFAVARSTHAPSALGLYEVGLLRSAPAEAFLGTMGDPPNVAGAHWATRMSNDKDAGRRASADLASRRGGGRSEGNLNTIGDFCLFSAVKLPGSGGGADIAILSRRWITLLNHEKRRLVERVSYVTSPGHGDGTPGWRSRNGLPGGGPSAIVTTLGVFRFPPEGGEAFLASVHPGHTVDEVRAETGWDLKVAPDVGETPAPTAEELTQIRRFDPDGFWTRRG